MSTSDQHEQEPGDPCPRCDGWLQVYTSRDHVDFQEQYFACWKCKCKESHGRRSVSPEAIKRRRSRKELYLTRNDSTQQQR